MREDSVPRRPPRDSGRESDSPVVRAAAWLGISVVTLAALVLVIIFYRDTIAHPITPIETSSARDGPAEPAIDAALLAQLVREGVAVALTEASPQPLSGELVILTPTPPPTPIPPTRIPTPGTMFCPDDPFVLPNGELCKGPKAPLPTPTPYPACQRPPVPDVICEVRRTSVENGRIIVHATPATTPVLPPPGPHAYGGH